MGGQYSSSSYNYGYNLIAGSSNNNNNSQNWSIVDIDGDAKLDLVVSSAYVGAGGYSLQYGATTNPYWKVYLNSSSLSLQKSERNIVLIYPNPTNESFKIKLQNELITAQVEVFNSIGTKVYSELSYKSQQDIICNQLTKGLYLVKIINGKGVTFQKILIQ